MRVLIACEFSGIVRDAFLSKGCEAWSCDFLQTESNTDYHIKGNVLKVLNKRWDLMIAHPPCIHLAAVGAQYWDKKQKNGSQQKAFNFFLKLINASIPHIAIENPIGWINTNYRKPDQIIQPYQFGEPYAKKTCLWLKNLPMLEPTRIVKPKYAWCTSSKYGGPRKDGTRRMNPLKVLYGGSKNRSRFFTGIALAMADQWSILCQTG